MGTSKPAVAIPAFRVLLHGNHKSLMPNAFLEDNFDRVFSLSLVQAEAGSESGHASWMFFAQ